MIKKILVATDGSLVANKAVRYATDLAKQLGATITLLGVIDQSYLIAQSVSPIMTPVRVGMTTRDVLKQATEEYLDEAVASCKKKGVQARKVIRTGHPAEEIAKAARREKADLVILGSHGRSALKAVVLGSVAFGVIQRDTRIPVLVVRK